MNTPNDTPPQRPNRMLFIVNVVLTIVVAGVAGWRYFLSEAQTSSGPWRFEISKPIVMPFHKRGGLPPPPANHESLPTVSALDLDRG